MAPLKDGYSNRQPGQPNRVKGRDQHLDAGGPSGPDSMELVKDHRRHGGLCAP
jgi:hypothetical protein